jgi:uncharacterized protein
MSGGKIILAGGSGFLGKALARELLSHEYEVVVLTRAAREDRFNNPVRYVMWDGKSHGEWSGELDGARAVVNLTGRNVNCRYSARARREILESRVDSVRAVNDAILACRIPPEVLVQAATLAILGNAGDVASVSASHLRSRRRGNPRSMKRLRLPPAAFCFASASHSAGKAAHLAR